MKHYKSNAQLKDLAKDKLRGNFGNAIFVMLLVSMITSAVSSIATTFLPTDGWFWNIVSILLTTLISAFLGILQTGITFYFLNTACGMKHTLFDIFYGFQAHAEKSIKISLVHAVLETICLFPFQILMLIFVQTFDYKYLLFAYIAMFIGYVITAPLSLALSQTYYLLLDFPDSAAKEVIKTSIRVMRGHKWRLFKLELSFLPLNILCLLSFGIGYLWLNPYMRMTYTAFFLDLMNPGNTNTN